MGMLEDELDQGVREAADMGCRLAALINRHAWWSRRTFGSDEERGPEGPLKHMVEEIEKEILDKPLDKSEYSDLFLLLLDASRRAGIPFSELVDEADKKMNVNEARDWGEASPDQPVFHKKD